MAAPVVKLARSNARQNRQYLTQCQRQSTPWPTPYGYRQTVYHRLEETERLGVAPLPRPRAAGTETRRNRINRVRVLFPIRQLLQEVMHGHVSPTTSPMREP